MSARPGAGAHVSGLGTRADLDTRCPQRLRCIQNGSCMLGIYRLHKYRRNLLTEFASVANQVA